MTIKLLQILATVCLLAGGEVHLITGATTPKGGDYKCAALWRIESDGTLTQVLELASEAEGLHRLDMLLDARKAVLMTKVPKVRAAVLDLDSHSVIKSCPFPKGLYEWTSQDPFGLNIYPMGDGRFQGLDLTPSLGCDDSLRVLASAEYALPITEGHAGIDQLTAVETVPLGIDSQRRIRGTFKGTNVYLGFAVPERFLPRPETQSNALLANTSTVLAWLTRYKNEPSRILILHKPSSTWTELPTTNYAGLRVFGKYAVITEGHLRSEASSKLPAAQREVSPGMEEWRRTEGKYGRNTEFFLRNSIMVYGGALHVFDSETRTTRTIRTRQADSEIVLIEGNDVYYRVSDRLYHAVLADNAIVDDKVIAKSEVIRDAHWAFLSK